MEAVCSFETLVHTYTFTRRHNPEHHRIKCLSFATNVIKKANFKHSALSDKPEGNCNFLAPGKSYMTYRQALQTIAAKIIHITARLFQAQCCYFCVDKLRC
jgi:hypothetical protein